jgi:hypothetical protein
LKFRIKYEDERRQKIESSISNRSKIMIFEIRRAMKIRKIMEYLPIFSPSRTGKVRIPSALSPLMSQRSFTFTPKAMMIEIIRMKLSDDGERIDD